LISIHDVDSLEKTWPSHMLVLIRIEKSLSVRHLDGSPLTYVAFGASVSQTMSMGVMLMRSKVVPSCFILIVSISLGSVF